MKRTNSILMTLGTALALMACGGDGSTDPDGNGGGGGNGGGDGDGDGGGSAVVIDMVNTAFVAPDGGDDVTVPVGTTITWTNRDAVQHTATSTEVPPGGQGFDTGLMSNGESRTFTPTVEGTWTYLCEVHPNIMVGATITATADGSSSTTDSGSDGPPSGDEGPSTPGY